MVEKITTSSSHENRQHPRFSVKLPIDYWHTTEVLKSGLVANLSKTGLLMYSVHKIETDTELNIRIYLSKSNSLTCIEGNAKVVWMDLYREQEWEGYKYGLYITEMPPDYQDVLMNYLLMLREEKSSYH